MRIADEGDDIEKAFWPAINVGFPNYEKFWQQFVIAVTNRIVVPPSAANRIQLRQNVEGNLWEISFINYSVFLNLIGAFEHISQPLLLSLGNFYTHLASACDPAEDFLLKVHMLVAECRSENVPELLADSKQEFLEKLDRWYDDEYERVYKLYHKKGRDMTSRPEALTRRAMSFRSPVRMTAPWRRAVVTTTASTMSAVLVIPSSRPAWCASLSPRATITHPVRKRRSCACCGDRLTWATTGAGTNGKTPSSRRALCSAHARRSFRSAATRTAAS